jgi:glycolate oxidase iron-sulfur subunit
MLRSIQPLRPLAAMLDLAPKILPRPGKTTDAAPQHARGRVILLQGCAEPVLSPQIRAAAVRLLHRAGLEVVFAAGEGCCGALTQHIGKEDQALAAARRNVDAWHARIDAGLTAVVVTASGCGSQLKTYGWMLRDDPAYAGKAAAVSALARDIVEVLEEVGLPPVTRPPGLTVAYHAACSLQHGQQIRAAPKALLAAAGFTVREPVDAHLCCGSAGTYNILQSEIAGQLRERKVETLEALRPDVIAAGNIGCLTQIAHGSGVPVVHTVELLDWATGGPKPEGL